MLRCKLQYNISPFCTGIRFRMDLSPPENQALDSGEQQQAWLHYSNLMVHYKFPVGSTLVRGYCSKVNFHKLWFLHGLNIIPSLYRACYFCKVRISKLNFISELKCHKQICLFKKILHEAEKFWFILSEQVSLT